MLKKIQNNVSSHNRKGIHQVVNSSALLIAGFLNMDNTISGTTKICTVDTLDTCIVFVNKLTTGCILFPTDRNLMGLNCRSAKDPKSLLMEEFSLMPQPPSTGQRILSKVD